MADLKEDGGEELTRILANVLKDGGTVAIGGVHLFRVPMGLVRALARTGRRDLHVITSLGALGPEMLILADCVKTLTLGFMSLDSVGIPPEFRRAVEEKRIDAIDYGDIPLWWAFDAAARGLPYGNARSLMTGDLLERHPGKIRELGGRPIFEVPAIEPDLTLLHCPFGDTHGNAYMFGEAWDIEMSRSGKVVVVSVDRVVAPTSQLIKGTRMLPRYEIEHLVELPYGAHPTSSYPHYVSDLDHLVDYQESSDRKDYLQRYVQEPETHFDYLEKVGLSRLLDLQRAMDRAIALGLEGSRR